MKFFKKKKDNLEAKFEEAFGNQGLQPTQIKQVVMPSLKVKLDKSRKELEVKAKDNAEDTAAKMRPFEKNDQLAPYIQYQTEEASFWCNIVQTELQAEGLNGYKTRAIKFAKEEKALLDESLSIVTNKIQNKVRDLRELEKRDIYNWKLLPVLFIVVVLGLFGDLLYNAKALQAIGLTYVESLFVVIPVITGLALGGYFLFKELKKDETEKRSRWGVFGGGLLILISFGVMGYVRAIYLREMNGSEVSMGFSTLMFIILNILIFGGVSIIFHQFWPTNEESRIHRNKSKVANELSRLEAERTDLDENRTVLKNWLSDTLQTADDIMGYHNALINENISYYRKIAADWIREVTTRLPYAPDCMTQPLPRVSCRYVQIDTNTKLLTNKNKTDE